MFFSLSPRGTTAIFGRLAVLWEQPESRGVTLPLQQRSFGGCWWGKLISQTHPASWLVKLEMWSDCWGQTKSSLCLSGHQNPPQVAGTGCRDCFSPGGSWKSSTVSTAWDCCSLLPKCSQHRWGSGIAQLALVCSAASLKACLMFLLLLQSSLCSPGPS